jgi:anaerobic magnesium-protoporphyrin IX monomethyl ester cyclase
MIEIGSELEMGIPPNISILMSALCSAGIDTKVFSTNLYVSGAKTGDQIRTDTLQVSPTSENYLNPFTKDMKNVFEDLLFYVKEYEPDVVGMSITEPMFVFGMELLNHIRNHVDFIIVGGAFVTLCPDRVISESSVDAICIGEGERPLVKLCRSIEKNNIDYNVDNLWFNVDGKVVKNNISPVRQINDVPFQDWSSWTIPPRSLKPMAGEINTTALVELSRGCPFKCSFCANSFLNTEFHGNYRERDVSTFIDEVKYLRDTYNVSFIYISDETILTTSDKRFSTFINLYRDVSIPFWCETRPESVSYDKIKLLKEVGLKAINIGVEGGNEEFRRDVLNRKYADDVIIESIHEAKKSGVNVGANVIIGFPGETRQHVFETINIIREAQPTSTMIHLFQPYAKTELRDRCVQMGLISDEYICGDYRMHAIGTGYLSSEEILGLQRTFNLYVDMPKNNWNEIRLAEKFNNNGNRIFKKLAKQYQMKKFNKTSF